ncbi:hypothetical protein P152DRAFT_471826 [Eremomyces bilateralis CBS 781.70]|uniref:GDP/GTP exchange factor Sec2 N-terminal domain-containing protein n=1 Tax=Eremomyces bilateralis CBS 781.70 TaxID=1392243 RepID=A0A6G1GAV8_9PEZI|nr:uncharacterized protein P152DRAFT_471826 [Eremomyces bilateralis CBS 781.70]KAF1815205.1 hypothetical protein P152DRAFT_471826 [Eremomyces bilateralis CBS 781.70]
MSTGLVDAPRPIDSSAPFPPLPNPAAFGVTCPKCGTACGDATDSSPLQVDARRRIAELEAQVRILTSKASTAVDKLADYEDELRLLKSSQATTPPVTSTLSSFLSRKPSVPPSVSPPAAADPVPADPDPALLAQLAKEKQLRASAESQLTTISSEMEDLSVTLFQQANEMVAQERKARAELEERVKLLEGRDAEKRKRLERLEKAMGRIERVRGILGQKT